MFLGSRSSVIAVQASMRGIGGIWTTLVSAEGTQDHTCSRVRNTVDGMVLVALMAPATISLVT